MQRLGWVWFAGCAAWLLDAIVHLRLHNIPHAQLALLVSATFLAAGLFYRLQKR
jgi:hypothetical protein